MFRKSVSRRSLAGIAAAAVTGSLAILVSAPTPGHAAVTVGVAAVAVRGTDDGLWVNRGFGWEGRGGQLLGAPALVYANGTTLYVATGSDHDLFIRSDDDASWRPMSASGTYCDDNPAIDVTGTTFTVACKGGDGGLWYAQTSLGGVGIPQVGGLSSLGGSLNDGPAITTVGGALTFMVTSTNQHIWARTLATSFSRTPWSCNGHPALASSGGQAYFACDGTDGQLWFSQNSGGGWASARPAGGSLLGGVGIAANPTGADIYVEGTDAATWHTWLPVGGSVGGFNGYGGGIGGGSGVGAGSASPLAPAASLAPLPTPSPPASPTAAPTASPTPTPPTSPSAATSPFVTRNGTSLSLNGQPYRLTGVNAYEAATDWGVNAGCGPMLTDQDLSNLFASALKANQVVRFWAFQALATNDTTKVRDWRGIDRVLNIARQYGVKVIPALSGQSGGCDDYHWKDVAWYTGGYNNVYDNPNQWPYGTPDSYITYMQQFLSRYNSDPTIAMIELVSEPSPTDANYVCVDESTSASALRSFWDTVGGEAHRMDPNHLLESGQQGVGQCGAQDKGCTTSSWTSCTAHDYEYTLASTGVDVASAHDYGQDDTPLPSFLNESIGQASLDGKPLIVGEVGMQAHDNLAGCMTLSDRTTKLSNKASQQLAAGAAGLLAWDWVPGAVGTTCTDDIVAGDSFLVTLRGFAI